jgi:nicotinamidase-related amidase
MAEPDRNDPLQRAPDVPLTLRELVHPPTTALVMWDFQTGLAGKARGTESVQQAAQRLLRQADAAGVTVIWSRHVLPPLSLTPLPWVLFLMRKQRVERPEQLKPSMQEGMAETEFLPGFIPAPNHIVLEKSQPSLFVDTPIDLRLKTKGIKTLVICGVATDIGVEFTARHAAATGYFPVIAEDACGAYTEEAHNRSIASMQSMMSVASVAEITACWQERGPR